MTAVDPSHLVNLPIAALVTFLWKVIQLTLF